MKIQLVLVSLIACLSLGFSADNAVWYKVGQGIYESDVRIIMIDPEDDAEIYAGTSKALYKSADEGRNFRMILRLSGENKGINDIYVLPDQPEIIYVATDAGLYESLDKGESWSRIYYSSEEDARQCHTVFFHDNTIYLGIQNGLLYRNFQERSWRTMKEGIGDKPVHNIAASGSFLYFSTGQAIFRWDGQSKQIKNVFSAGIGGRDGAEEESSSIGAPLIRFLKSSVRRDGSIFVGSSKGIFVSRDSGENWKSLSSDNLSLNNLMMLLIMEKNCSNAAVECFDLLTATKRGVFFLSKGRWMPVYKGMETNDVAYLAKNTRGTVYAATARGIFYLPTKEAPPSFNDFQDLDVMKFDHEPDIYEVHRWAIAYAEVSHKKIEDWRRQARKRAWLPKVGVGIDGDRDWSRSDSIWGSYTVGGQYFVGPDDKTHGEDLGWDVSLSWDLADLVWSTDQTTIDSRSKLMVELREDILNEVTRIYFERRRVQIELAFSNSLEVTLKIDKEMRIAELSALINALTGGKFGRRIKIDDLKRVH